MAWPRACLGHKDRSSGNLIERMLSVVASAPPPNAAAPAGEGASASGEGEASEFLAMLKGAAQAGKDLSKKPAQSKPAEDNVARSGEAETAPRAARAGRKSQASDAEAKSSEEAGAAAPQAARADGEAARSASMPQVLLAALAAGARSRDVTAGADPALAAPAETPAAEPGRPKAKVTNAAARRDGAESLSRPGATPRAADPAADPARAAKPEGQPATGAVTPPRIAEAAPTMVHAVTTREAAPHSLPLPHDTQVSEGRVPLGAREAAQSGFSAPILAMRVVTKDGVTKSIEIRLDPAELGKVDVKLETGHDGRLKAVLSAENAAAFELLKRDGAALEAALRDAGLDLEEGAITFTLNHSAPDNSQQREAAYGDAEARRAAEADELAPHLTPTTWRHGVIDISV